MSYILTSHGKNPGYYIARNNTGHTPRDYLDYTIRENDGRLTCTSALTFKSVEKAKDYLSGTSKPWKICGYDTLRNCITSEISA